MAEQKALAKYLYEKDAIAAYLKLFKSEIELRLHHIYDGFIALKEKGYTVDAVTPQAAIYLTIKIDLVGKTDESGHILSSQADVTSYILSEAKIAVVPFSAFGGAANSPWYRLSVGTCIKEEIPNMLKQLETALSRLK
jgi:aspartate aminotransferase